MKEIVFIVEQLVDEYYDEYSIILVTKNEDLVFDYHGRAGYIVSQHVLEE